MGTLEKLTEKSRGGIVVADEGWRQQGWLARLFFEQKRPELSLEGSGQTESSSMS